MSKSDATLAMTPKAPENVEEDLGDRFVSKNKEKELDGVFRRLKTFRLKRQWREVPVRGRRTGTTAADDVWRNRNAAPGGMDTQSRVATSCSGGGGGRGGGEKGSWLKL